jgi:hypothetical protein
MDLKLVGFGVVAMFAIAIFSTPDSSVISADEAHQIVASGERTPANVEKLHRRAVFVCKAVLELSYEVCMVVLAARWNDPPDRREPGINHGMRESMR